MSDDFSDAFDDWIGGASISKRSLVIFGKPGLYARMQELEREYARAVDHHGGEAALGESDVPRIEAEMEEIVAEWQASKSTWTVRPLSDEQTKAIKAEVGIEPRRPARPPENAPAGDHATYARKFKTFDDAEGEYADAVNLRVIVAAVESIKFADGRTTAGVTLEQLQAMRSALGDVQLQKLINETTLATAEEPVIEAPKSRKSSQADQT